MQTGWACRSCTRYAAAWDVPPQGVCVFPRLRDKVLTEIAAKRLSGPSGSSPPFGSGFRIAMRDLQIRGAGGLLGHSQHGHMEAVGYDLYVKMLGQAIATARGEAPAPDKERLPCGYHGGRLPAGGLHSGRRQGASRPTSALRPSRTTTDAEDVLDRTHRPLRRPA